MHLKHLARLTKIYLEAHLDIPAKPGINLLATGLLRVKQTASGRDFCIANVSKRINTPASKMINGPWVDDIKPYIIFTYIIQCMYMYYVNEIS
jgi:hypothetical protein